MTSRALRQAGRPSARNAFSEGSAKTSLILELNAAEMTGLFEDGEVEHVFTDRHADTCAAEFWPGLKTPNGRFCIGKWESGGDFNKRTIGGGHGQRKVKGAEIVARFVKAAASETS